MLADIVQHCKHTLWTQHVNCDSRHLQCFLQLVLEANRATL